jgi:hypothetical protein
MEESPSACERRRVVADGGERPSGPCQNCPRDHPESRRRGGRGSVSMSVVHWWNAPCTCTLHSAIAANLSTVTRSESSVIFRLQHSGISPFSLLQSPPHSLVGTGSRSLSPPSQHGYQHQLLFPTQLKLLQFGKQSLIARGFQPPSTLCQVQNTRRHVYSGSPSSHEGFQGWWQSRFKLR